MTATDIEVSFSELDSYRQCRLKHQLAWKERWRSKDTPDALQRGTDFHRIMELHYAGMSGRLVAPVYEGEPALGLLVYHKEKVFPADPSALLPRGAVAPDRWVTSEEILGRRFPSSQQISQLILGSSLFYDVETGQTDDQALLEWMYRGYAEKWATEDQQEWEILAIEHPVSLWLPSDDGPPIRLKGKIDLIVRERIAGGIWIVDHKTCKNLPRGKDIDLDDQLGCYIYLLRRGGEDQPPVPVRGGIFNHVRTQRLKTREMGSDERFRRSYTVRTDVELETMALEVTELMQEAHKPRRRDAPRSPDPERCGWKCSFTEVCLAGRKGQNMQEMLKHMGYEQDYERH